MGGNPKDSPWRNGGPEATRKRPHATFTLPPDVIAALKAAAAEVGLPASVVVEKALRKYLRI